MEGQRGEEGQGKEMRNQESCGGGGGGEVGSGCLVEGTPPSELLSSLMNPLVGHCGETDGETDRQTDRQTDRV